MKERDNIIAIINLQKLNGAVPIKHNNKLGIFIPFVENYIFVGAYGKFLKLYILEHKDKFGNDVIIARSLSPMEKRKNVRLRFLGHGKYESKTRGEKIDDSEFIDPDDANPFI